MTLLSLQIGGCCAAYAAATAAMLANPGGDAIGSSSNYGFLYALGTACSLNVPLCDVSPQQAAVEVLLPALASGWVDPVAQAQRYRDMETALAADIASAAFYTVWGAAFACV
jgi:hypothetical protein